MSASGKWGPLLITETPDALPQDLRAFLLAIKPGYEEDPTRAVYNHVWLIGDASAIGASVQAEIDELAEPPDRRRGAPRADHGLGAGSAAPGGHDEPTPQQDQPGHQGEAVSEVERADRLQPGRRVTVEDIRALAGPPPPTSPSKSATGSGA